MNSQEKKVSNTTKKRERLLNNYTVISYLEKVRTRGQMYKLDRLRLQTLFAHESKKCEKCPATEDLSADHIVPIFLLKLLGYNADSDFRLEWYQPLCHKCNRKKGCSMEWDNPRTFQILNQAMIDKPTHRYDIGEREQMRHKATMDDYAKRHGL